jgi:hypothetical protein
MGGERIAAIAFFLASEIEPVTAEAIKRTRRQTESERVVEVGRAITEHVRSTAVSDEHVDYTIALFNGLHDEASQESFQAGTRLMLDAVSRALQERSVWDRSLSLFQIQNLLSVQFFNHIHTWAIDRGVPMADVLDMLDFAEYCAEVREEGDHD